MWVVEDDARNALALGRGPRTAALVLTSGLADALDPVALEGVLAHELTHIKRNDIAPATVSSALLMPLAVCVPGMGALVHRLAGRGREFHTDRLAVAVTRYPPGLREALSEITVGPPPRPHSSLSGSAVARTTRWLWTVALPVAGSVAGAEVRSVASAQAAEAAEATQAESVPSTEPVPAFASGQVVGELDAAPVRIAALDEW
jgi:Zn-dependent protease with chaperone function